MHSIDNQILRLLTATGYLVPGACPHSAAHAFAVAHGLAPSYTAAMLLAALLAVAPQAIAAQ